MLVATASLGLIAPIAAQASDVINLEGMNDYNRSKKSSSKRFDSKTFVNEVNEDLAILKGRVDGLEAKQNNFEAGSFSDTTTMDGKAIFTVQSVDTDDNVAASYHGQVHAAYTYQLNLNTSFNGDDNLYVRLKSGNHDGPSDKKTVYNTYLSSGSGKSDAMTVDKIWYTLPIGERNTVFLGPKVENYYMHGTTPSIYKPVLKSFTLGGNAAAYGADTSPGAGWKYEADNGFAISSNFTTQDGNTSSGMLTDEGPTSWATQVGYTQPRYSVSAIVNMKYNDWTDSYFQSTAGKGRGGDGNSTNIGLRGWWRPESTGTATPSISAGYDTSETDNTGANTNTTAYFVGLNWQDIFNADDRIGIAVGQPQKLENDSVDPFLYEIYYSYRVNDSTTITPAFFGGTSKNSANKEVDMTGFVVETQFNF